MNSASDPVRHRYLLALRKYHSVLELSDATKYSESTVKGWLVRDRTSSKARLVTDRTIALLRHTIAPRILAEVGLDPAFREFTNCD